MLPSRYKFLSFDPFVYFFIQKHSVFIQWNSHDFSNFVATNEIWIKQKCGDCTTYCNLIQAFEYHINVQKANKHKHWNYLHLIKMCNRAIAAIIIYIYISIYEK